MNEPNHQIETADQLEGILKPRIYSKGAIWGFAFLLTPLFGGVLLMQNLKDIEKRKEANLILVVSFLMTLVPVIILTVFNIESRFASLFCNFACAAVLSEYFYKKYFPDDADYEKKKIWKPLIIGVAIMAIFILLLFVAQDQGIE